VLRSISKRGALFAENKFQLGKLALIPAVRVEFAEIRAREVFNVERVRPIVTNTFSEVVPLFGIGATYEICRDAQAYANVSQGYRPPKYDDLVNPTAEQFPAGIAEGDTMNYEVGVRGQPAPWFRYDASFFFTDWDNYVENLDLGGGDTQRVNSGRAEFMGWELFGTLDLIGLADRLTHSKRVGRVGSLTVFGSLQLLDADFVSGRNLGRTPAYAPDRVAKVGAVYRLRDCAKIALTGTRVDKHFWQDSNAAGGVGMDRIPSYGVWDLTAEARVNKHVSVFGGINNVFDEDYFSRVRSDGIDPAARRNGYVGVKITY
jgi:Fe(3+) dicitrate transport protein